MLSPFFQPCYTTVLDEKCNSPLSFFRRATFNYYSAIAARWEFARLQCYSTVQEKREFQLRCIEFNVPRTNYSIKQPRGKNHEHYGIGPDQLYPRAFGLRPNRVLLVLSIFKGLIDEKMLALRLRTSAT